MTDMISRSDAIVAANDAVLKYLTEDFETPPEAYIRDAIRALPAAQVADPAQIRADALREAANRYAGGKSAISNDEWDYFQSAYDAILAMIDNPPAVPSITVAHDYQPSLNAMDQGDCAICGNGPHTRVVAALPAVSDDVAALVGLSRLMIDTGWSRWDETVNYNPDVTNKALDLLDRALAKMKGGA